MFECSNASNTELGTSLILFIVFNLLQTPILDRILSNRQLWNILVYLLITSANSIHKHTLRFCSWFKGCKFSHFFHPEVLLFGSREANSTTSFSNCLMRWLFGPFLMQIFRSILHKIQSEIGKMVDLSCFYIIQVTHRSSRMLTQFLIRLRPSLIPHRKSFQPQWWSGDCALL